MSGRSTRAAAPRWRVYHTINRCQVCRYIFLVTAYVLHCSTLTPIKEKTNHESRFLWAGPPCPAWRQKSLTQRPQSGAEQRARREDGNHWFRGWARIGQGNWGRGRAQVFLRTPTPATYHPTPFSEDSHERTRKQTRQPNTETGSTTERRTQGGTRKLVCGWRAGALPTSTARPIRRQVPLLCWLSLAASACSA